jgi:hypothetical protein
MAAALMPIDVVPPNHQAVLMPHWPMYALMRLKVPAQANDASTHWESSHFKFKL